MSREEQFAHATSVFIGHIVQTKEIEDTIDGQPEMIIEGTFRVVEMLKGSPPANGKIKSRVYGPGNCTIPIMAGTDYLLFIHEDSLVSFVSGSGVLLTLNEVLQDNETKQLLQVLRQLRDQRRNLTEVP